jgi:putative phosphoesterase
MKIAVIADIHANARALSAVLDSARHQGVDALVVAGDIIGYYFEPSTVLRLLRDWQRPMFVVKGNHEEMLQRALSEADFLSEITRRYGPGIKIAIQQMCREEIEWLLSLPHPLWARCCELELLLCHGSPHDINQYLYPDSPITDLIASLPQIPDMLITGHTHYPMVRNQGACLVINPGSVGQPRNRKPGAHWLLLDTESRKAEPQCESYDVSGLQSECMSLAPDHPYLHQVLTRS